MKDLMGCFAEHSGKGSDKWRLYVETYNDALNNLKDKPISLLEIGVQNGGGLEIWSKYFPCASRIIGCDIDEKCGSLKYTDERISVVIGDINNVETQEKIFGIESQFDLIIDDGSHTSNDIVKTFLDLFPKVKNDGIYIIEDLHCSYWAHYGGGLFDPNSSINFLKLLVDVVNFQHWGNGYARSEILKSFFAIYKSDISEVELSKVHSVEFVNSICIIKKKEADRNLLGDRLISGNLFDVCPSTILGSEARIAQASEFGNKWAFLQKSISDIQIEKEEISKSAQVLRSSLDELEGKNLELAEKLSSLNDLIKEKDQVIEQALGSIKSITSSYSWKMTKIFRLLGGIFR